MRISFDLDDTLICHQEGVPCEPALPWYLRLLAGDEPLRLGARALMRTLHDRGWELWVYTTSHRPPGSVRRWLWCHGVRVAGVINRDVHDAHLRRTPEDRPPSKNPAAFGIALHVDDSDGVRMEGDFHGFDVVVVAPDDLAWAEKVLLAVEELEARRI
jgi:hypothetical protein